MQSNECQLTDETTVEADSLADAVEQARDQLDRAARGLNRSDGFSPGDRVYAIVRSPGDDQIDVISLELTTDHVGEDEDVDSDEDDEDEES